MKAAKPGALFYSQKQVADALGLSARQVHNLVDAGMPREVEKGRPRYPWPAALRWYVDFKVENEAKRLAPTNLEESRARKMAAEAELAEVELAKARAEVATTDDFERALAAPLERVRARLLNAPGKYAPQIIGLATMADAVTVLDEVVREVMAELAGAGADDGDAEGEGDDADDQPGRAA